MFVLLAGSVGEGDCEHGIRAILTEVLPRGNGVDTEDHQIIPRRPWRVKYTMKDTSGKAGFAKWSPDSGQNRPATFRLAHAPTLGNLPGPRQEMGHWHQIDDARGRFATCLPRGGKAAPNRG